MENYELAVQSVKAVLFDRVYREQGLVDILAKQIKNYNLETQERLSTLFTKQKEDIERVLGILDEFGTKMNDVLAQSKEIMEITNDVGQIVSQNSVSEEEKVEGPVLEEKSVENATLINVDESNTTEHVAAANDIVIPGVVVDAGSVGEQVEAPTSTDASVVTSNEVVTQPVTIGDQNVQSEVPVVVASENTQEQVDNTNPDVPVQNQVEIPSVVVENIEQSQNTNTGGVSDGAVEVPSIVGEQQTSEVAPIAEVIKVPGQTGALDDSSPVIADDVYNTFVLSPVDEGVAPVKSDTEVTPEAGIAAADAQLQAVENMKNEIIHDTNLSPDVKAEALEKYTRATASTVKAILVTKVQYEKLLASRTTQKALLNAKQGVNAVVETSVLPSTTITSVPQVAPTDEQTLIANGLLEPTVQDKQREMQTMMEQANTLYKAGRTQEAQELFNKVSVMNKEMQAGSQGQMLVKS